MNDLRRHARQRGPDHRVEPVEAVRQRRPQPAGHAARRSPSPPARGPSAASARPTDGSRPLSGSWSSSGRSAPKFCRSQWWVRRAPGCANPRSAMFSRASVAPISRRSPALEVPAPSSCPSNHEVIRTSRRGSPPRDPSEEHDLGPPVERRDNALHRQLRRDAGQVQQERGLEARSVRRGRSHADLQQPHHAVGARQPERVVMLGRQPLGRPGDAVVAKRDLRRLSRRDRRRAIDGRHIQHRRCRRCPGQPRTAPDSPGGHLDPPPRPGIPAVPLRCAHCNIYENANL